MDNDNQPNAQRELTYGEKAVGLTFNPSKFPEVDAIKRKSADLIDEINNQIQEIKKGEDDGQNGERIAQYTLGIRRIQEGQMWAVKSATWNK